MAFGRPSEYDATKHPLAVADYVSLCKENNYLPTIEGLAVHLSVARSSIYLWAEKNPEFSDILEQLLAAQASQLIQNGLVNNYNPTITKLMLSKHSGADGAPYRDKTEVDHTSKGERIAGFNFISNGGDTPNNQSHA